MQRTKRKGFTLIEILIVIGIIGILAVILLANLRSAKEKANIADAQSTVRAIRIAITIMEGDTNEWPGHQTIEDVVIGGGGNEIWDLTTGVAGILSTDGAFNNWDGPYLRSINLDPWGNPYFFDTDYDIDQTAGTDWAVVVGSFGPNGVGQNVYDSDDIIDIIVTEAGDSVP